MTGLGRMVIVPPGGGTEFHLAADRFWRKGSAKERGPAFAVVEYEGAAGGMGPPLHLHRSFEEAWYILSGEVGFVSEGKETKATPGTYLPVPRGVPHTFRVTSGAPARWIGIFAPGRYVGMIEELGAVIPARGAPDPAELRRLFTKWDSELVAREATQ